MHCKFCPRPQEMGRSGHCFVMAGSRCHRQCHRWQPAARPSLSGSMVPVMVRRKQRRRRRGSVTRRLFFFFSRAQRQKDTSPPECECGVDEDRGTKSPSGTQEMCMAWAPAAWKPSPYAAANTATTQHKNKESATSTNKTEKKEQSKRVSACL